MPEPFSIIALVSALAPIANKGISKILQSETVQNLGGSFLSGPMEEVSGSLAQTGFNKLVSSLPTILSSPENHDILRAVRRSYLNATLTMCFARLKILNPSKSEWKNLLSQTIPQNEEPFKVVEALRKGLQTNDADTNKEIEWLFRSIRELNQSLADIADWKTSAVIEQAAKASEVLLKPENAKNQIDQLKTDLKSEVIKELAETASFQTFKRKKSARKSRYWACLPPTLLKNLNNGWSEFEDDGSLLNLSSEDVEFEWFDVMSVFFAEEIKTNTRVSDIFNAKILADLKYQNGQPCNFSADLFAEKLAESNKILLERLTNIEKEVSGLSEFKVEVREYFSQFIPLILTVSNVADIVSHLATQLADISKKLDALLYSYKNLVTFQKWRERRIRNEPKKEYDYVETEEIKSIVDTFTQNVFSSDNHFILKGDISSGKSTIINKIGETLLKLDENIKIIILPLTREFQLEEGWQRKDACWEFNECLKQVASSKISKTVFIVEDAHEGEGNPGHLWARDLDEDFSLSSTAKKLDLLHIPLLVTTRPDPDKFKDVKGKLKKAWKIEEPKVYETKPEDIVNGIITDQSVPETTAKKLRDSYLKCGKILLIFNEIIQGWKKNKSSEGNFMIYAYKAVYEEFKRVLPKDLLNDESWLTLAIIWMAGGLELGIEESFIHSNFLSGAADKLLEQLEKSNEIHRDDDEKYIPSRHPAWGLLTIAALDNNYRGEFNSVVRLMRERFLDDLGRDLSPSFKEEIETAKPSVLLMTALLNSEVTTPTSLGFYCSGRLIQDEFITAVGYHYNILLSKPDANKERISESLLSIATNVRQNNTKGRNAYDPVQRQEVIKEGYERLTECIKLREELSGGNLENDLRKGAILYEEGYYQFLKGDFAKSAKVFQESKNAEINSGNTARLHYAAMSGVMEANSLIWDEKLDQANKTLEEIEQILENIDNVDKNVLYRFKSNTFAAYVELYLAKRNVDKALESVKKYMDEGDKINLYVVDLLYKARISLLTGEGERAEQLVKEALGDNEFMKGAENIISAHRILGDALLMQDKKEEATKVYNMILPSTNSDSDYLDFNLRIIKARMKKIDDGGTIKEAFQGIRI